MAEALQDQTNQPSIRHRLWTLGTIGGLCLLAFWVRWIGDDAFISFRYADHLAHGLGLVWNPGERIEGFTNLLWTLVLAAGIRVGLDPINASMALGICCFAGSLLYCYKLAFLFSQSRWVARSAMVLLGFNYTFLKFATSGLETQAQAFLFSCCTYILLRCALKKAWPISNLLVLSSLWGISAWLRLDSGVLFSTGLAVALVFVWPQRSLLKTTAIVLPLFVLVSALVAFKLLYFGELLPNSFYARSPVSIFGGFVYLATFFVNYWYAPLLIIAIATLPTLFRQQVLWVVPCTVFFWLGYVFFVGGDFMEYRFMVPIMPLLFAWGSWVFGVFFHQRAVRIALVVIVFAGSAYHWAQSYGFPFVHGAPDVETIPSLTYHTTHPSQDWIGIGKKLGEFFPNNKSVVIATPAAGAIPYYSRLTTIDQYGINDAWIARNGIKVSARPGHQHAAPLEYLLARKVNLVIYPWAKGDPEENIQAYLIPWLQRYVINLDANNLPKETKVIELPINKDRVLRMLYLTPHPMVDAYIKKHRIKILPILR